MHDLADTIFGPVLSMLGTALSYLSNVSMVAARGLNLNNFLGPLAGVGPGWATLIKSFLGSVVLVAVVLVVVTSYNLYLKVKEGVQWW